MSAPIANRDPQARTPQAGQPQSHSQPSGSQPSGAKASESSHADRPFLSDVKTLRQRARQAIEEGAVTPGYDADRKAVCRVLNEALATEIVCVLRYKRHYFMADGIHAESVKAEFKEHAAEEQKHADQIAERIVQLGGEPDLDPKSLASRSHAEYVEGETLVDMIREDLIAERIAIESYREIVAWLGSADSTTRRLMEEILAMEEEHADDLVSLLRGMKDGLPKT
ncbi:MAG: ferritin-like domain-containing protein [Betaproteobacteria bacterium]